MTKYLIMEAHSGTNEKEIKAAKKDFLKKEKMGFFGYKPTNVNIHFKDKNNQITWDFYDAETHQKLY